MDAQQVFAEPAVGGDAQGGIDLPRVHGRELLHRDAGVVEHQLGRVLQALAGEVDDNGLAASPAEGVAADERRPGAERGRGEEQAGGDGTDSAHSWEPYCD